MSPAGSRYPRTPMSTTAASHLSPAFPERAAWGTASKLRAWQAAALDQYLARRPPRLPRRRHARRRQDDVRAAPRHRAAGTGAIVRRVTVVAPTEHLKTQWADAAGRVGISIDPNFTNAQGRHSAEFDGVAAHLRPGGQQAAAAPRPHRGRADAGHPRRGPPRRRQPVLGRRDPRGVRARHPAALPDRHAVPLRHQPHPVRHLRRGPRRHPPLLGRLHLRLRRGAARRRRAAGALPGLRRRDALAHQGRRRGRRPARRAADQGPHRPGLAHGARPQGRVDPGRAGRRRPPAHRGTPRRARRGRPGHRHRPDPGPRLRQDPARRSPARSRVVVLSDDAGSSGSIEEFAEGDQRWMVAVRMVSEGVDVPRLCVGVYATSTSTPLFFAQAVGRFVRARRRGETASVFLPTVPLILEHAATAGGRARPRARPAEVRQPPRTRCGPRRTRCSLRPTAPSRTADIDQLSFEALESEAEFDHVLFDAEQFGLRRRAGLGRGGGLPRAARPARARPGGHPAARAPVGAAGRRAARARPSEQVSAHRALAASRKELNALVSAYARKNGAPHAVRPHRPAPRLRRPRAGPGDRRAGDRADRDDPALVRRPALRPPLSAAAGSVPGSGARPSRDRCRQPGRGARRARR